MIRRSSLGPTKVVIGLVSIVVGLFVTIFGGIAFLFHSLGGLSDFALLMMGLITLFMGLWITLDAFFADAEVHVANLDELALVLGRKVVKCKECKALNPANAKYCMKCGEKIVPLKA